MRGLPDLELLESPNIHSISSFFPPTVYGLGIRVFSSPLVCDPRLSAAASIASLFSVYCLLSFRVAPIDLFHIPKRVMLQNGGPEIAQAALSSHQDVRTGDADNRKARSYQFLHPIIESLTLREVEGTELPAHQAIHFRFPRGRWTALARVPQVSAAAREPDVHLRIGIHVAVAETEYARLVIVGLKEAVQQDAKLQRQ